MVDTPAPADGLPGSHAPALMVLAVMVAVALFGGQAGPYGAALASVGIVMVPLGALAVLVHVGAEREWARWGALALMVAVSMLVIVVLVGQAEKLLAARGQARAEVWRLYVVMGVSLAGLVLALLTLAPAGQRLSARILPMEPGHFGHALALSMAITLTISACAPLWVLGEPVMSALAAETARSAPDGAAGERDPAALFEQLYHLLWLLPVCFLAVGFGVRRGFRAALVRLGLRWPSRKQAMAAVAAALVLAAAALILGALVKQLWSALGWRGTDRGDVQALMGYMLTPLGALVVGVSAGLGEELLVRGVLQPRLGLWVSNLVFTAMHAGQYSWDMLIVIFFVGAVFGAVRARSNTTVSALVHGLYDAILIVMSVLASG